MLTVDSSAGTNKTFSYEPNEFYQLTVTHLRHLGSEHKQYARSPRGQQQQQTQMSQCIKRRIGFIPELKTAFSAFSVYRTLYCRNSTLSAQRENKQGPQQNTRGTFARSYCSATAVGNQFTTLTPLATHTCKQMYTILEAAKLAVFHLEQNGTASTAVVKKDDPYRVSASFLVTLILPFLTLLYLEMARSQTNAVPAPISLKTFPTLNCAGHSGDEPSVKLPHKSDEKVHAYRKKVTWVASSPQLMSRTNLCDISQLQILIPAPPARTIRRTSNNSARASFTKQSNDTILCPEECVVHLVEETLAYFKLHKPLTQELRLLIPKLEQFAAWNERNFMHSIQ